MPAASDVVIIGGGVAGCSIAYHLARQGVSSQIIERDAIASQASGKAWGVISPPTNILLYMEGNIMPRGSMTPCLKLSEEGIRRFPHFAQELREEGGIDVEYGELPVVRAVFDEKEEKHLKERVSWLQRDGFDVKWMDGDDVKAFSPDIAPGVRGGTLFPGHQVEPYKYTLALAQAAEAKGASIRQGEALGFRHAGSRVTSVIVAAEEIKADIVVLAMGPWTGQGTSWLRKEIPMRVLRDQCLVVELPYRLPPYRILSGLGGGVGIIPKVDGKVILGRVAYDDVDFDDKPTEAFRLSVMEAAVETIPRLEEASLVEQRVGLEACQPAGGLPMLGRLPGWDNVYVATWLSIFGIQWSPAVGRVMADLIIKGRAEETIESFNPARFV
jgi:glycine oxidase